jgi:hypothetical protein
MTDLEFKTLELPEEYTPSTDRGTNLERYCENIICGMRLSRYNHEKYCHKCKLLMNRERLLKEIAIAEEQEPFKII